MEEYVLICEDSTEGILTGVYEAYRFKKDRGIASHDAIHLVTAEPEVQRLFTEYVHIQADHGKAAKVTGTIAAQLGDETWYRLSMAMVSCHEEKADAVYHTVVLGLKTRDRHVTDRLKEDCVQGVFKCARASDNELCHLRQFLRFSELQNGMLYAKIDAKHHVLPYLMPHFADRLPADDFVIYDENTQTFGLHARFKKWYLMRGADFDERTLVYAAVEETYQELFRQFCDSIAIEARINPKLQMNMLPLRFRPNMTEFQGQRNESADGGRP